MASRKTKSARKPSRKATSKNPRGKCSLCRKSGHNARTCKKG